MHAIFRRISIILGALLAFSASAAQAVTLDGLEGQGFEPIYGDYAPGGDCSLEPMVTIDATGFTFHAGGATEHRSKVEYAVSFLGPDYDGISQVFFPFPLGDYEFGRVLLTVNANEQQGLLQFDDNSGPGDKFTPMEAALVKASTMQKCAKSAAGAQANGQLLSVTLPYDATPWETVQLESGSLIAYVAAGALEKVNSFSVFCSEGKPTLAMLLDTPQSAERLATSWRSEGKSADITLARSNREGTFWQAYLDGSGLLELLMYDKYEIEGATLFLGGNLEGIVSLVDAPNVIKPALSTCTSL